MDEPRFQHDCDVCVWLGRMERWDLYSCPQNGHPTVVARYGDDGPEYESGRGTLGFLAEQLVRDANSSRLNVLRPTLPVTQEQLRDAGNVTHAGLAIGTDCVQSVLEALGYAMLIEGDA